MGIISEPLSVTVEKEMVHFQPAPMAAQLAWWRAGICPPLCSPRRRQAAQSEALRRFFRTSSELMRFWRESANLQICISLVVVAPRFRRTASVLCIARETAEREAERAIHIMSLYSLATDLFADMDKVRAATATDKATKTQQQRGTPESRGREQPQRATCKGNLLPRLATGSSDTPPTLELLEGCLHDVQKSRYGRGREILGKQSSRCVTWRIRED